MHPLLRKSAGPALGLTVSAIIFVMTVAGFELVFGWLLDNRPAGHALQVVDDGWYEANDAIGYWLASGVEVEARATIGPEEVYRVTYRTDDHHRRVTPLADKAPRSRFLATFGCSFTFGVGVEDDETPAAHLGALFSDYRPYNYGLPGAGPQHTYLRLQAGRLAQEIPEAEGIGVYFYIDAHLNRAIGAMPEFNSWVYQFPYIVREGDDLVNKGSFAEAQPLRTWLYRRAFASRTLRYFDVNFPLRRGKRGATVVADLLEGSARAFEAQKPGARFVVVIWQSLLVPEALPAELERRGIEVINLSEHLRLANLGANSNWDDWYLACGHPRPILIDRVTRLVADALFNGDRPAHAAQ